MEKMSTDNRAAWTRYYESTLSKPRREQTRVVQSEKQAPMVLRGAEKQIAEDNAQFRRYNRAKAAAYRTALESSYGPFITKLHSALRQLDIEHPDPLLRLVVETSWLSFDQETRYTALSMIDDAITRLREQNGLAPFDDAIFDDDPTVFQICKAKIGVP
jgi:hypothetical protein